MERLFSFQTTLARIVARTAKQKHGSRFVQLSATSSGVSAVKEVITAAKNDKRLFKRRTLLFIDEIHRFNKLQQVTINIGICVKYLTHTNGSIVIRFFFA